MGFSTGGELAEFIRSKEVAPYAMAALRALPEARQKEALLRCAAAFESAANSKNGGKILSCSVESIIKAVLFCAMSDLYPGGLQPKIWLIPYKSSLEAQVSFHGLRTVALRSGNSNIRARAVFEGEHFEVTDGTEGERFRHERYKPGVERSWEKLIAVYCVGNRPDGTVGFEFLDRAEILKRRDASKAKNNGPWVEWPTQMALKTGVRYAINRGTFPIADRFELALRDSGGMAHDVIDIGDVTPTRIKVPETAGELLLDEKPDLDEDPTDNREPVPVEQAQADDEDGMMPG